MSDIRTIFKPRRGKKTTFTTGDKSSTILGNGEIFFEYPDNGPGTGRGRIMMGDGSSTYATMGTKYFIPFTEDEIINHPGTADKSIVGTSIISTSTINTYLNNAKSGNTLKSIIHNLREAIYSNACNIVYLNNNKSSTTHDHNSVYGAKTEAIKNITRSGTTFTATRCDNTTFTFSQQDNNTWRNVQNNLTSDKTDESLSAYQGKVLYGYLSNNSINQATANKTYCNGTNWVHWAKAGRIVTVAGRFQVTTQKPAGQSYKLFTGLPDPAGSIIPFTGATNMFVAGTGTAGANGFITSNDAVVTGYYNISASYLSR